jgi:hypothetical protein
MVKNMLAVVNKITVLKKANTVHGNHDEGSQDSQGNRGNHDDQDQNHKSLYDIISGGAAVDLTTQVSSYSILLSPTIGD